MSLDIRTFSKGRKWDWSNKSDEGGKSGHKQRERSLNDSSVSDSTEVFVERLKSSECVSIIFNGLKNLEKEIEIIKYIALTTQGN